MSLCGYRRNWHRNRDVQHDIDYMAAWCLHSPSPSFQWIKVIANELWTIGDAGLKINKVLAGNILLVNLGSTGLVVGFTKFSGFYWFSVLPHEQNIDSHFLEMSFLPPCLPHEPIVHFFKCPSSLLPPRIKCWPCGFTDDNNVNQNNNPFLPFQIALTGSVYSILSITVERYICCCFPHISPREGPAVNMLAIGSIVLFSILFNITRFFEYETEKVEYDMELHVTYPNSSFIVKATHLRENPKYIR